jgi:hypothetical protein
MSEHSQKDKRKTLKKRLLIPFAILPALAISYPFGILHLILDELRLEIPMWDELSIHGARIAVFVLTVGFSMALEPHYKSRAGSMVTIFWSLVAFYLFAFNTTRLEAYPINERMLDAFWLVLPATVSGFLVVGIYLLAKKDAVHARPPIMNRPIHDRRNRRIKRIGFEAPCDEYTYADGDFQRNEPTGSLGLNSIKKAIALGKFWPTEKAPLLSCNEFMLLGDLLPEGSIETSTKHSLSPSEQINFLKGHMLCRSLRVGGGPFTGSRKGYWKAMRERGNPYWKHFAVWIGRTFSQPERGNLFFEGEYTHFDATVSSVEIYIRNQRIRNKGLTMIQKGKACSVDFSMSENETSLIHEFFESPPQEEPEAIESPPQEEPEAIESPLKPLDFVTIPEDEAFKMLGWADEIPNRIALCVAEEGFSMLGLYGRHYAGKIDIKHGARICNEEDRIYCYPNVPLCLIPRRYFRTESLSDKDAHKLEGKITSFISSLKKQHYDDAFLNLIVCGNSSASDQLQNVIKKALLNNIKKSDRLQRDWLPVKRVLLAIDC